MRLYLGGAETPTHRKRLEQGGAESVSLSFWSLRPRLGKKRPYIIANRFPEHWNVMVDSGGYSANRAKEPLEDVKGYLDQYHGFVEKNSDRIALVTDFDFLRLSVSERAAIRKDFWDHLKPEKFAPVWHPEDGFASLDALCERYDKVAITEQSFKSVRGLASRLRILQRRYGADFHGASVTDADLFRQVRFGSAMTTAWISPTRFGETQVWDGTKLRRYPASMKNQARRRHRALFQREGFDAEAIEQDDREEVTRLTLWSWRQVEENMGKKINRIPREHAPEPERVTEKPQWPDGPFVEVPEGVVGDFAPEVRNSNTVEPRPENERRVLPVLSLHRPEDKDHDEVRVNSQSLRKCDNCFVSSNCPAFTPGQECAFDFPVRIETKDQLIAVLTGMIEMQTHRVAFMRYAEEMEGGYADPNLSMEMDRLFRLTESLKDIQDNSEYMKVAIETRGGAGVLSRIFGDRVGQTAAALQHPLESDALAAEVFEVGS